MVVYILSALPLIVMFPKSGNVRLSRGHGPVTLSEQVAKKEKSYVLEYNSADLVFH